MPRELLVPCHIDEDGEYLKLDLWRIRLPFLLRQRGTEMSLYHVETRVQHCFEKLLVVSLVRYGLATRLERLPIRHDPETVVALLEEFWQRSQDSHAVELVGQVDRRGLLHFLLVRPHGGSVQLVGHALGELESHIRDERIFDTCTCQYGSSVRD